MLELLANLAVIGVFAVPGLILMYLVKAAGEDALRDYADELNRKGATK